MLERVSFGPFTLDSRTRQLSRGADPSAVQVHLSPKAYELLCVLLAARPAALGKAELHERLWPATYVSDGTLTSLVAELRHALGEGARDARFIRTVHKYGYAFTAEAREAGAPLIEQVQTWLICEGREVALHDGEHIIGRDPTADVPLASPSVSRRHARIAVGGGGATIEDLGSKNSTLLRGQAVVHAMPLKDGDLIRLGTIELTFRSLTRSASTETLPK
jgi:DNA-binding winged helix-turn-helix (wHTH) protein